MYVEFHPVRWSIGADLGLTGDDYFATAPFIDPDGYRTSIDEAEAVFQKQLAEQQQQQRR